MSSLQDKVIGAFPETSREDLSVWELSGLESGSVALEDLEREIVAVKEELGRGDVSGVPRLAALTSNLWIVDEDALFSLMLAWSEVIRGDRAFVEVLWGFIDRIEEKLHHRRRDEIWSATVGDWDLLLVYMREIWDRRTVAVLAQLAGASQSTARRWINGHNPSWRHKHSVWAAGQVAYTLREDLGMSPAEVRQFFETPLEGKAPLEEWSGDRAYLRAPDSVIRFLEDRDALPPGM